MLEAWLAAYAKPGQVRFDPGTGALMGAVSDQQVKRAGELVTDAGQPFEVVDLPDMAHAMHAHDPQRFTQTIADWSSRLGSWA